MKKRIVERKHSSQLLKTNPKAHDNPTLRKKEIALEGEVLRPTPSNKQPTNIMSRLPCQEKCRNLLNRAQLVAYS